MASSGLGGLRWVLAAALSWLAVIAVAAPVSARNDAPGHYVALGGRQDILAVVPILRKEPAIRGVLKRYYWSDLEPEKGQYDFSAIERDLALLRPLKRQLVAMVCDKTFSPRDPNPVPAYLRGLAIRNKKGGFTAPKWNPEIVDREIALARALGRRFGNDPFFQGIATPESAPSLTPAALKAAAYSPEKLRDGLVRLLTESSKALPNARVFWFMNFLPGNNGYLEEIAEAVEPYRVAMGGPDILPYRDALRRGIPLYQKFADRLMLFGSVQNDSYRHHRLDRSNDGKRQFLNGEKPLPPEGYVPLEEIFEYGRDQMKLDYIFWTYKTWKYSGKKSPGAPREWTFDDALEVIRRHPEF